MAWLSAFLFHPVPICLLCALLALASFCLPSRRAALGLPPGPTPLPIIGNLHLLDFRRQDKTILKLAKKYGPVFTLYFGFQKVVVLTGYEAVKDALVNFAEEFVDRPVIPIFQQIQGGNGIFFSTGELWRATRRFSASSMRNLGMGKARMEEHIREELGFLVEDIKSFKGEAFSIRNFNLAPTNITFVLLFGERFDYKDPMFLTLLQLIDDVMCLLGSPFLHIFNFYPFLGIFLKAHKKLLKKVEDIRVIIRDYVEKSRQEGGNGKGLRSYTDAWVSKQKEEMGKKDHLFHEDNVIASILDLVMAGTETAATTMQWVVLLMMKYPKIQKKVQEEIRQAVKPGSWVTYEDQKRLPYTNAVIHEVQRFITLLPHIPRATSVDTHFRGYFLPKGTMIIPSLTSVLLDKSQWETPDQFNPNHFLDADGNFVKRDAFVTFSLGRRNCMGENLAKMELFLFVTGLLQKFTFRPPPGLTEMDLDLNVPETTFTLRPVPQMTCAVPQD
ncbi:cytochrome P450 2W1 [Anolis carolinensis]|nr:PREDICTED: cytochrome P450 2W1 [Anolis carolinensis]|eukprot:XP_003226574.1 PREDICTED: cytochrome P450 2W1 [Anolis carolinensis]